MTATTKVRFLTLELVRKPGWRARASLTSRTSSAVQKVFGLLIISTLAGVVGCGSPAPGERPPANTRTVPQTPKVTTGSEIRTKAAPGPEPDHPRAAKFKELDTDHDGKLTLLEFSVGRTSKAGEKWFKRRDVDHDGFIRMPEFLPVSASDAVSSTGKQDSQNWRDAALPPDESPKKETPSDPTR